MANLRPEAGRGPFEVSLTFEPRHVRMKSADVMLIMKKEADRISRTHQVCDVADAVGHPSPQDLVLGFLNARKAAT
jgi:hypothetical protein